jgi:hypothetical protein
MSWWGRLRKGGRRIDVAIDHFGAMCYATRDVRAIVNQLLEVPPFLFQIQGTRLLTRNSSTFGP